MPAMCSWRPSPLVWRLVCGACILLIVLATTWPWTDFRTHTHWAKVEWIPFTHRLVVRDLLLNLLLFIPLGFSARKAWPDVSPWWIVAAAAALSLTVETYQLFTHRRFPTTVDLMANSAGAWIGTRRAAPVGERAWVWQI
jgi:glycopeptide antibiotics resistance protein